MDKATMVVSKAAREKYYEGRLYKIIFKISYVLLSGRRHSPYRESSLFSPFNHFIYFFLLLLAKQNLQN